MKAKVREAFLAVREQKSPDAVIADPYLNQRFIDSCRNLELKQSAKQLNLCLLNLRKAGALKGISKSERVTVRNQSQYTFAGEIAVRHLERRDKVSLDEILCDPKQAARFDEIATSIAPGFTSFEYRWAALGLRKKRSLRPELISRLAIEDQVSLHKVDGLSLGEIPLQQGLYIFLERDSALYVGECQNLFKRIEKHLDHSDNKGLARWLWQNGILDLHLEIHVLPVDTSVRARKALESELIQSRRPIFNIAGVQRNE